MDREGNKHALKKWIGNILFSVYVFLIMIDPTNVIFHLKEIAFVLFMVFNVVAYRPNLRYLPAILLIYAMLVLTSTFSQMQMAPVDYDALTYTYKSFLPLVFLLWVDHYNVIKLTLLPAFLVGSMYLLIYVWVSVNTNVESIVYTYSRANDDLLMMSHRYFYGVPVFAVYLRSTVGFSMALFSFYYSFFHNQGNRLFMFIASIVITMVFWGTGSRATMLFPVFILGLVFYNKLKDLRLFKYFFFPFMALAALLLLAFVVLLGMEKSEASNVIKFAHLGSYAQLFSDHPIYLLIGEGPGTKFYSAGFHRYTPLTEWTYLELIRNYGLFAIIPLGVVLYPLICLMRGEKDNHTVGIIGSYALYLLVASTNPLLFSSTGMLIIWSAYSQLRRVRKKKQEIPIVA